MDASKRNKIKKRLTNSYKEYIESIPEEYKQNLDKRFAILVRDIGNFLKKQEASGNYVYILPKISNQIFGLHEDIRRHKLNYYNFQFEKEIVNQYLINLIEKLRNGAYWQQTEKYGEKLLNCYLDIFLKFTIKDIEKEIDCKPSFLINPNSENLLELDVLYDELQIAFEFQGRHHYESEKDMEKDKFKLNYLPEIGKVLIPVNISQLNSVKLSHLIVNTLKDTLGLHGVLYYRDSERIEQVNCNAKQALNFCMILQRVYMASVIYKDVLSYLDNYATRFRSTQMKYNKVSCTTPAPRYKNYHHDMKVDDLYRRIKYVKTAMKNIKLK